MLVLELAVVLAHSLNFCVQHVDEVEGVHRCGDNQHSNFVKFFADLDEIFFVEPGV